jgi:transposase-like protein
LERGGKVHVELIPSVRASEPRSLLVAKVKRGSLVYTDQFKGYDGLVAYDFRYERIDKTTRFANGRVYLNGIEGFWSFAKERLAKFHGMSVSHFPLYLKDHQFRYNHRPNCFQACCKPSKPLWRIMTSHLKLFATATTSCLLGALLQWFFEDTAATEPI